MVLENGRARAAQVYPQSLCQEICKDMEEQAPFDKQGQFLLAQVDVENNVNSQEAHVGSQSNNGTTQDRVRTQRPRYAMGLGRRLRGTVRS